MSDFHNLERHLSSEGRFEGVTELALGLLLRGQNAILRNQDQILQELKTIMSAETDLLAEVQSVKDDFTAKLQALDTEIKAAADRVIASLSQPGFDPAATIAALEDLKATTDTALQSETDQADAIDPATPAA